LAGPQAEQRLAAILAADVAGYTRLMAEDEQATVAALDAARAVFRREIAAEHGRVVDTAGDSVLAVFASATGAVISTSSPSPLFRRQSSPFCWESRWEQTPDHATSNSKFETEQTCLSAILD